MEKKYSSYETLFVVDLSLGGEAVRGLVSKFIGMISENGVLTGVNEWGKRRLAYPINDKNEGYYVVATFNAPQAFPAELDRVFGITEGIMRSMTVVTEPNEGEAITYEPKAVVAPAEEAPAQEVPTAEEAPAAEEQPAAEEAPAAEEVSANEEAPAQEQGE